MMNFFKSSILAIISGILVMLLLINIIYVLWVTHHLQQQIMHFKYKISTQKNGIVTAKKIVSKNSQLSTITAITPSEACIISRIMQIAQLKTINIIKMQPKYSPNHNQLIKLELTVNGNFFLLQQFIAELRLQQFIFINLMELASQKNVADKVQANLQLNIVPANLLHPGIQPLIVIHDNPFSESLNDNVQWEKYRKFFSTKYSISQYVFGGYLIYSHQILAILTLANNNSFPVRIGDVVGQEQAVIAGITRKELVLNNHGVLIRLKYAT